MAASPEQLSPRGALDCLTGGGEMGALMRSMDWSLTPLGPFESWPQSLRTTVSVCLSSRFPIFVMWGPELVMLYNDAYRPMLGATKHPRAMGSPGSEIWTEVWPIIGPMLEGVLAQGEATWSDDQLLLADRNGFVEECYFTFSYSPIRDESGSVGGVFCAVTETSRRVLGERRLQTLRALAEQATQAKTAEEACALAARTFESNPHDLPFALLYLLDDTGGQARLMEAVNLPPGAQASLAAVSLRGEDDVWSFRRVLDTGRSQVVDDVDARFGRLPAGPWEDDWIRSALVLPLAKVGVQERPAGFLVAGVSPRLAFDDDYRGFFDLTAGHLATAIANARAYEEERKRAEALAPRERLEVALASARVGVWQLDLLTGKVFWSPELYDLLGFPRGGFEPSAGAFFDIIHPADLERNRAEFAAALAGGDSFDMEFRVTRGDGMVIWVSSVGRIVRDAEGRAAQAIGINQDITARRQAEEESRRYRMLIEQSPDFIGMADLDTRPILVNEGARRMVGLPEGFDWGSVKVLDFFLEEDRGTVTREVLPELMAGRRWAGELRFRHFVTGEPIPVWYNVFPVKDDDGRVTGLATVTRDIRPQKQAEEKLQAALDGGRLGAWSWDPATGRTEVDRRVLELFGVDPGTPMDDDAQVFARVHPDDLPAVEQALRQAQQPGTQYSAEFRVLLPDGQVRWLAGAGRARFDAAGAVTQIYGVNFDITERKRAEQALRESERRFHNMADNAPVMIWVTEPDGSCSFLSKSWYEFTGQTPETGLGFGWLDAIHPDDHDSAEQAFLSANVRHETVRIEYRLRRRDGSYRWALDSATPRLGPGGEFRGYIGSVLDITERKEMEDALKAADRRKDEFLAMLAHELRNPLAPIRNAAQVLKLVGPVDAHQQWAREVIERQTQHLTRLVDDLLDVSRITQGKVKIAHEPLDLATVLLRAVEASRPLIDARHHHLTVAPPPETVRLEGDLTRLVQVVSNLLNNAAKYTDEGGRIHLEALREGGEAVIRVRDNGMGLPADLLPHVFDLFTQADRSLDRSQGGLGIGLTLVRQLVELHGGRVEARSGGFGQGSEFIVRLPALAEAPEGGAESPAEPVPPAARALKILVVEDNADSAQILTFLLELGGHQVRTAGDGVEALEAAGAFQPQVVLCDIGLPGMNGYEVAARLRQRPGFGKPLLVALTGYGQEEARSRAKEAGFDYHLVKPVEPDILDALLDSLRTDGRAVE